MNLALRLGAAAVLMFSASCQAMSDGDPSAHGSGKMCGGIAAFPCAGNEYCKIEDGKCRTVADVSGVCRPKPDMCPMIYQPVCGCDGKTYANSCVAASKGASVAATGECPKP